MPPEPLAAFEMTPSNVNGPGADIDTGEVMVRAGVPPSLRSLMLPTTPASLVNAPMLAVAASTVSELVDEKNLNSPETAREARSLIVAVPVPPFWAELYPPKARKFVVSADEGSSTVSVPVTPVSMPTAMLFEFTVAALGDRDGRVAVEAGDEQADVPDLRLLGDGEAVAARAARADEELAEGRDLGLLVADD